MYTTSKQTRTINNGLMWTVENWQNIWTSSIRVQTISVLAELTLIFIPLKVEFLHHGAAFMQVPDACKVIMSEFRANKK